MISKNISFYMFIKFYNVFCFDQQNTTIYNDNSDILVNTAKWSQGILGNKLLSIYLSFIRI